MADAQLGDDGIERHVMGIARDVVDLLARKGEADEAGTPGEVRERTSRNSLTGHATCGNAGSALGRRALRISVTCAANGRSSSR